MTTGTQFSVTATGQVRKTKAYLSGPISGNPNARKQFAQAQWQVEALGYEVINPAELPPAVPGDESFESFMVRDIDILLHGGIDVVVLLPRWIYSRGASVEVTVARAIGLPLLTLYGDTLYPLSSISDSLYAAYSMTLRSVVA